MTTITITDETVDIELTGAEKMWSLHGDLRIPRSQIRAVEALDEPLTATRGLRAPGLALPGRVKMGTWRAKGGRQFVIARRGVPGVRLHLEGNRYDQIILSVNDEASRAALLALA